MAHRDEDKIRLRYCDEDGDIANICQADVFVFSETLRTAKEMKDRAYKKIFIKATETPNARERKKLIQNFARLQQ